MISKIFEDFVKYLDAHAQVAAFFVSVVTALIYVVSALITQRQARLTEKALAQSQMEYRLSLYPFIVQSINSYVPQPNRGDVPESALQNIGQGIGIHVTVFYFQLQHQTGEWLQGAPCNLGSSANQKVVLGPVSQNHIEEFRVRDLKGIASNSDLINGRKEITIITCRDQFGTWHRFRSDTTFPELWNIQANRGWRFWNSVDPDWEPWPLSIVSNTQNTAS